MKGKTHVCIADKWRQKHGIGPAKHEFVTVVGELSRYGKTFFDISEHQTGYFDSLAFRPIEDFDLDNYLEQKQIKELKKELV